MSGEGSAPGEGSRVRATESSRKPRAGRLWWDGSRGAVGRPDSRGAAGLTDADGSRRAPESSGADELRDEQIVLGASAAAQIAWSRDPIEWWSGRSRTR